MDPSMIITTWCVFNWATDEFMDDWLHFRWTVEHYYKWWLNLRWTLVQLIATWHLIGWPQVNSGTLKDLFPCGSNMEPMVTRLQDDRLALGRDQMTIFIDSEGMPTQKYALTWNDIPSIMCMKSYKLEQWLLQINKQFWRDESPMSYFFSWATPTYKCCKKYKTFNEIVITYQLISVKLWFFRFFNSTKITVLCIFLCIIFVYCIIIPQNVDISFICDFWGTFLLAQC